MYFLKFGIFRLLYPLNISLSSFLSEPNANPKYLVLLVYSSFSKLVYKDGHDNLYNLGLNNIQKDLKELNDKLFFFGKMIFIVCEQKNRQKNTNKCYIQHT